MRRMNGGEKALVLLAAGGLAVLAFKGDASAATAPGGGSAGLAGAPIIVPEANLPQAAVNWYDQALTQLGFAGSFSDRLMGFQTSRMQNVLAPELSRLTPATQQAIQSAVAPSASTGDLGDVPAGCYRSRY